MTTTKKRKTVKKSKKKGTTVTKRRTKKVATVTLTPTTNHTECIDEHGHQDVFPGPEGDYGDAI